jgi:hypothetical protein
MPDQPPGSLPLPFPVPAGRRPRAGAPWADERGPAAAFLTGTRTSDVLLRWRRGEEEAGRGSIGGGGWAASRVAPRGDDAGPWICLIRLQTSSTCFVRNYPSLTRSPSIKTS